MSTQNTDSRTVWIGDLQTYMDEVFLNNTINQLKYDQSLASIKIIKDKVTGIPNKYGFIEFNSHQIAEKFMQQFNGKPIPGAVNKYFKLKWASYGGGVKFPSNTVPGEISIYVGDLDSSVNELKLMEFFKAKYPSVFGSKIIYDLSTKISKGYGFVKFTNADEAQRAIAENNGTNFNGRTLKVSHAYIKTKEEKQEEDNEQDNEANKMMKTYQQFFSMTNDPLLKAAYDKQVQKTFGGMQNSEKTIKQRLQNFRTIPYEQTKPCQKYVESFMRVMSYQAKKEVQGKIFSI